MKNKLIITLGAILFLTGCANSSENRTSNPTEITSESGFENSIDTTKKEKYFTRTIDECLDFIGCEIAASDQIGDYDFYLCNVIEQNADIFFSTKHGENTVISIIIHSNKNLTDYADEIMDKFKDFCLSSQNQSGTIKDGVLSYDYYTCGNYQDTVVSLKNYLEQTIYLGLNVDECLSKLKESWNFSSFTKYKNKTHDEYVTYLNDSCLVFCTETDSKEAFAIYCLFKEKYDFNSIFAESYFNQIASMCTGEIKDQKMKPDSSCFGYRDGYYITAENAKIHLSGNSLYLSLEAKAKYESELSSKTKETTKETENTVPAEYTSALNKALSYSETMHMSKMGIYNQLVSEYGEKFSPEAAQYAIDNMEVDWKANALAAAENYSETMHMSKMGIYNQLISEYGEQFTAEEAQYAVDNVKADWKANALATAKNYQDTMNMSPEAIRDQLISEYGEQFTAEEADYAISNLN